MASDYSRETQGEWKSEIANSKISDKGSLDQFSIRILEAVLAILKAEQALLDEGHEDS